MEGSLVPVAAPDNGDDLAAVGVVACAAGVEVGIVINALVGHVGEHDDHVGEAFGLVSDLVVHLLAVLVPDVLAGFGIVDHLGVLLGLLVVQVDGDVGGVLAGSGGAILGEPEAIVPIQGLGPALLLGVLLIARADAEEAVLQAALVLLIPVGGGDLLHHVPGLDVEVLNAPFLCVGQGGAGTTGVCQDQVIMLGDLVENGSGRTGGADGLHAFDVAEQSQAANHVVHVDVHLHDHIGVNYAHMGQILPEVADGAGVNPTLKGRVQQLAVHGVPVNGRLGGYGGRLGGGLRGGLRRGDGQFLRSLAVLSGLGVAPAGDQLAAAAQQHGRSQCKRKNSFHTLFPFLCLLGKA